MHLQRALSAMFSCDDGNNPTERRAFRHVSSRERRRTWSRGGKKSLTVNQHQAQPSGAVLPTSLSSADSVRKRPMASLMTSVSSMSGCSSVMLFLFSSSHSWKPVFGLNGHIREAKSLQPGLVFNDGSLKRDGGRGTLPLVLRVVCRRGRGRSLCLFLLICRLFLLTGCLCA